MGNIAYAIHDRVTTTGYDAIGRVASQTYA